MTMAEEPRAIDPGFSWKSHHGPYRILSEDQARQFDDDGYFVLPGVLDTALLADLEEDLDRLDDEIEGHLASVERKTEGLSRGGEITFNAGLVARSERARSLSRSVPFVDLAIDLLGPDTLLYWDQSIYKKPEAPRPFPWHQDNGYAQCHPQVYLSCWIPLVPTTVDNGCLWVWPSVHRLGTLEHEWTDIGLVCKETDADSRPVEVGVGDVVVFSSVTPHRTGPNTTNHVRKAYLLQYAPVTMRGVPYEVDEDRQYQVSMAGQPIPEPRST